MFGEDRMIADLTAHRPDYLLIVSLREPTYGQPDFGKDDARQIARWVRDNYNPAKIYGALPFQEPGLGMLLMTRKPSSPATTQSATTQR